MDRHIHPWLALLCAVLAFGPASATQAEDTAQAPGSTRGFDRVLSEAEAQGKLVLIDFFTDW